MSSKGFFFSLFLFGFYDFQTILKQLHVHRQTTLSIPCLGPLIFPAQQQLLSDLLCLNVSQQFFFFLVKKLNAHKVSSAQLCRYNEHMLPAGNACTDLFYQTCLPKLGSEEFTSEEKRTGRLCVYPANRKRLIYGGATS